MVCSVECLEVLIFSRKTSDFTIKLIGLLSALIKVVLFHTVAYRSGNPKDK